jgi:hypothetical protein
MIVTRRSLSVSMRRIDSYAYSRDLNSEARDLLIALNQAQVSLNHALRLIEQTYQHRRAQIMNGQGPGDHRSAQDEPS